MILLSFPGHWFDAAFPPLCQDHIAYLPRQCQWLHLCIYNLRPLQLCASKEKGTLAQKTASFLEPGKDAAISDPQSCCVTVWIKALGRGPLQRDGPASVCRCCSSPGRWSTGRLRERLLWPPPLPHELQTSAWPLDMPDSNTSLTDDGSWEGFWFLSEAKLAQGSSWQLSTFISTQQSGAEHPCCCGGAGHEGNSLC